MVKFASPDALRKRLGIKRLKKKILVPNSEKAAVAGIRGREKHRTASKVLVHA